MLELSLRGIETSNCYDSMVISLLKYYKYDYKLLFLGYYYAKYLNKKENFLREYIYRAKSTDTQSMLKKFFDIDTEYIKQTDISDVINFINNEMLKSPLGIFIDPYDCYWSPMYQKVHFSHFCLIIDIDYEKQCYVCVDIYYPSVGNVFIPYNSISKICNGFVKFIFNERLEFKIQDSLMFIKENISLICKDEIIIERNNMTAFINNLELNDIGRCNNLETSVPLINLLWIAEDKKLFSIGLKYLEQIMGMQIFSEVYEPLKSVENRFISFRNQLIKCVLTNSIKTEKLIPIIHEIYNYDLEIIDIMNDIIRKEGI